MMSHFKIIKLIKHKWLYTECNYSILQLYLLYTNTNQGLSYFLNMIYIYIYIQQIYFQNSVST